MEVFNLTLTQMLTMFVLLFVGFLLRKKKILPENAYITLSKLETYALLPALNLHTFMNNCTIETFANNYTSMFYGLGVLALGMTIAYLLCGVFVRNSKSSPELAYQKNIYKYALTFGNHGFLGNFIVLGIWGSATLFKYSMFTMLVSIICTGWGMYILIPKDSQKGSLLKNISKGIITPPMIAMVIGIIFGLCNLTQYVPKFAMTVLSNASSCMGPVAMLLAGVVIGGYDFKELLKNKKVYIASALRLIAIPALMLTFLKLIGAPEQIQIFALVAFAAPLGLNTIVYPAAYGGDTKTGASMTMISSTFSVITIPLMYLIFIVLL